MLLQQSMIQQQRSSGSASSDQGNLYSISCFFLLLYCYCWLVILSTGLDAPGISRMNHFTAEVVVVVVVGHG